MSIIIIRGFSQSGKDYIGNILCTYFGYTRFAFADSLKKIVAAKYNCHLELLHTQEGKLQVCESDDSKRTHRQILLDEGFHLRNQDDNIFANHCCQEIRKAGVKKIVITDWRYPNEINQVIDAFPDYKVYPVHILRQGQEVSPVDNPSEYLLRHRMNDYTIVNEMDVSIYEKVERLISFVKYDLEILKY